MFKGMQCN